MPHSQPTALQQTVCKFHLDPQYHISQWGSTVLGDSTLWPHYCLLNRLFGCRSKKTSKLRVTGLCAGNSPWPVNSPHKWPVTRKKFPFDDVIMLLNTNNVVRNVPYSSPPHESNNQRPILFEYNMTFMTFCSVNVICTKYIRECIFSTVEYNHTERD